MHCYRFIEQPTHLIARPAAICSRKSCRLPANWIGLAWISLSSEPPGLKVFVPLCPFLQVHPTPVKQRGRVSIVLGRMGDRSPTLQRHCPVTGVEGYWNSVPELIIADYWQIFAAIKFLFLWPSWLVLNYSNYLLSETLHKLVMNWKLSEQSWGLL